GVAVDSGGAVLPGVTVRVANRTAVTDAHGRFVFTGVPIGEYVFVAELPGFSERQYRVKVTSEHGAALYAVMNLSSVTESITVTAAAPSSFHRADAMMTAEATAPVPSYSKFKEHDFVEVQKEHVTTFAIDVDRASYAIVRRHLTAGLVPPPAAVRIEEMLNYFTWSYPQPQGGVPFSITSEVAGCPWNEGSRLVRIGIQGRNLEQWKMAPNNLVFLIDVSGSMSPVHRLPLLQSAFRVLVQDLRAEDRVALVVYAGAAGLVLPPTSGADKPAILTALDNLRAGGTTAGGAGIELAYKVAQDHFLPDGNNRVILATDGDFNVGVSNLEALQQLIEEKRQSGVYLSVLGVGEDNLRDDVMETLADKGNGNYAYLDSLKEAEKVFRRELTGTLVTIAKDVKVQVDFDPAVVASYRQIGYENRALENKDFEDDTKDAGELGAGHSVTALYEITPARSDTRGAIATVKLRYKEPKGSTSIPLDTKVVDEGRSAYEASADMQFAAAIAQFGMLLRGSPHKGRSSWDDVAQLARLSMGADLDGTREEFTRMVESARGMADPRVAAK
ncbi:MAG TPA: von Willebrand factor type A domain-containing protein, partial [Thermoanaerobaculia bacterium]|nr:von Willebrand factor type A domain-containing protein [Thermoanaerobaculia bacterium]